MLIIAAERIESSQVALGPPPYLLDLARLQAVLLKDGAPGVGCGQAQGRNTNSKWWWVDGPGREGNMASGAGDVAASERGARQLRLNNTTACVQAHRSRGRRPRCPPACPTQSVGRQRNRRAPGLDDCRGGRRCARQ